MKMARNGIVYVPACTVVLGIGWGWYVHFPGRPPTIYTHTALLSLALLAVRLCRTPYRGVIATNQRDAWVCGVLAVCIVGVMLLDPFLMLGNPLEMAMAALVLNVFILIDAFMVYEGDIMGACAASLFLATCIAMITSNLTTSDSGSGFLTSWRHRRAVLSRA